MDGDEVGRPLARLLILAVAVAALVAYCTPASAATAAEYWPHMQKGVQKAGLISTPGPQHVAMWLSYGDQSASFHDPYTGKSTGREYWGERDGWFTIVRFDALAIGCLQVEVVDLITGLVTPLICPPPGQGHQYVPALLPKDPWKIRVWGTIEGGRVFYWESSFRHATSPVENKCWYEGTQSRSDALFQSEAWWSNYETKPGGWSIGADVGRPFDPSGRPIRLPVQHGREVTLVKGTGIWTLRDLGTGWSACTYSIWNWK